LLVAFGSIGVLFYLFYAFLCVFVDIVSVSTEEPVGVDREQFFEEEQSKFLGEEGKWTSPTSYSILSYIIA
jgi:hypothetical protein